MCDYSLDLVASRPAKVGDKLVSTSFSHTTTRGFASVDDRHIAVCLLPGTELAFEEEIRCETGILLSWRMGHKVAKFRQVDTDRSNVHHDALEFPDGKTVLLTNLCKGQLATVLQLPAQASRIVNELRPQELRVRQPHAMACGGPALCTENWLRRHSSYGALLRAAYQASRDALVLPVMLPTLSDLRGLACFVPALLQPMALSTDEARAFFVLLIRPTYPACFFLDPVRALYWAAVVNGVLAAPLMAVMMLIVRNPRVMGRLTLSRSMAIWGWAATAVMATASLAFFTLP